MAKIITQHRRGTTAEWEATGVIPVDGEIIIVDDNGIKKLKIGDGKNKFTDLPYIEDNLVNIIAGLNNQLQEAINGADPLEGSWETEVQNIRINKAGYVYPSAGEAVRSIEGSITALESSLKEFIDKKNVDGLEYTENYELYLTSNGQRVSDPVVIVGGAGGGGGSAASVVTYTNLTTNNDGDITTYLVASEGTDVFIKFKFKSVDDNGNSTGPYRCDIIVGGTTRKVLNNLANDVEQTINVTEFLSSGNTNTVKIKCIDAYEGERSVTYTIEIKNLTVSSTYDSFTIQKSNFDFYFNIKGNMNKRLVFTLDPDTDSETELSSIEKYYSISQYNVDDSVSIPVDDISNGIHVLKLQAFCTDEGSNTESTPKYYTLMIDKNNANTLMLASNCTQSNVEQGSPVNISFYLYNPNSIEESHEVVFLEIYTDKNKSTLYSRKPLRFAKGVKQTTTVKTYPAGPDVYFGLSYYDSYIEEDGNILYDEEANMIAHSYHTLNVIASSIDVQPVSGSIIHLCSKDKSNTDADKGSWISNGRSTKFEGFNWISNGWLEDKNGDTALRINGGATATVDYYPFANLDDQDGLAAHGFTIEIDFSISDLKDRNCAIFKAAQVSDTTKEESSSYTFEIDDDIYIFPDHEEDVLLYHNDTHWICKEGVSGVPVDVCLYTEGEVVPESTYVIDDTTTLSISGNTLTVSQRTTTKHIQGLYATPDTVTLGTSQRSIECRYKDNERVRVSFTIDTNTDSSARFIACYVDGTLSGITHYTGDSDKFSNSNKLVFGDPDGKCTINVYNIRIYNKSLSAKDILANYIYDHSNVEVKRDVYADNNIYLGDGVTLDYSKLQTMIPTITFYGDMPSKKGDKKIVKMDFVDPQHPERNFEKVYGGPIDVEIDVQGTSSQYYVRKNWKIKLNSKDKTSGETLFNHDAYQHMTDEVPAKVFCIKVDYAEGTGTHNTQNANYAETLYNEKVPAQYDDNRVRTTVAGFPCIIFEKESLDSGTVKFSSKGNFNFDKDAEEAFGFSDKYDVECWEFCNNVHNTTKFLTEMSDTDWADNFEARCFYPKYINYSSCGYSSLADLHDNIMDDIEDLQKLVDSENSIATASDQLRLQTLRRASISRFKRMHDWVVSTKTTSATNLELTTPVTISGTTYTTDSSEYRIAKFKSEFTLHFNMEYSLIYYIYTFFALMTDQRAKNMFLTYWGRRVYVDEKTNCWWIDNINTNIDASNNAPVPELSDDGIEYFNIPGLDPIIAGFWYPYLYDNDTCYGIDNSGNMVFDYYHEDTDTWDSGQKYVYNGQESTLWTNFRIAFSNEIKSRYGALRSGTNPDLSYDKIYDQFITQGSEVWSASIYNEDAEYKYITMARQGQNGINTQTGLPNPPDYSNLYQVRGDGKHHLMYFLQNRFNYCDSKWDATPYTNDNIFLRGNFGEDDFDSTITVTPYSAMYCAVRYGAASRYTPIRRYANVPVSFSYHGGDPNDLETTIFGGSNLSSIGDLSRYYCSRITFSHPNKLVELKLGDDALNYKNNAFKGEEFSLTNCPLLERIDVSNCFNFTQSLDLSSCANMKEVKALGTNITGVTLSKGGYVTKLHIPSSVNQLILNGQKYLKIATAADENGLGIGRKNGIISSENLNITNLCIYDCPEIETMELFYLCLNSNKLERVCLNNISFEYDSWKDIRNLYTPKQTQVHATNTERPYYIAEGTYINDSNESCVGQTFWKRGFNNAEDTDTHIPFEGTYGYGLSGIDQDNKNVDYINITGSCVINSNITGAAMKELVEHFPNISFSVSDGHTITSTVYFMSDDGSEIIATKVASGNNSKVSVKDIDDADFSKFSKASSIKYDYLFTKENHGWSTDPDNTLNDDYVQNRKSIGNELNNVLGDRYLYPVFHTELRKYPVNFYNDNNQLLYSNEFEFDSEAVYAGDVPQSSTTFNSELYPFAGWDYAVTALEDRVPDVIVNERSLNYNAAEGTYNDYIDAYAVYKTIDEQYEIPNELELYLSRDDSSNITILGRNTDAWIDASNDDDSTTTNVFVRIPEKYKVDGIEGPVTAISNENGAFSDYKDMQLIELPDTLTHFNITNEPGAFKGCTGLKEFTLGKNIVNTGYLPFSGCSNLTVFNYDAANLTYNEETQGDPNNKRGIIGGISSDAVLNICENVQNIPYGAFRGNSLSHVQWKSSSNIININGYVFNNTPITSMCIDGEDNSEYRYILPENLGDVENNAFQYALLESGKLKLLSGTFNTPFNFCSGLTEIYLSKDVTIETNLFNQGVSNLINFVTESDSVYEYEDGKFLYNKEDRKLIHGVRKLNTHDEWSFNDCNISVIGDYAFYKKNTTEVEFNVPAQIIFNSYLTQVNQYAFTNNTIITSVDMSNASSLKYLGQAAFDNCVNINKVILASNLETINNYCFRNVGKSSTTISQITIPSSVTYIGMEAFKSANIESIIFANENATWDLYIDKDLKVTVSDLTDKNNNAKLLTNDYASYIWKRRT